MGPQYYSQFFPQEEIQQRIRDARAVLSRKDESEIFSFFQRVRPTPDADFQWYFTSMKVLKRQSGTEKEEVVVISHKVSGLEPSARKMHRLLDENEYMKKHLKKFASLTKREKEVITMLVNGRSSGEIGSILCISTHTVNTHRKNINEKLQCRSFAEMLKFAMAFDLIEEKF
jgi:DNA-binding CsgD family transcriptional regulator